MFWLLCLSLSHIVSFSSGLAHHDHYHLIPQLPSGCPVISTLITHSSTDLSLRQYPEPPPQISSSDPRLSPHRVTCPPPPSATVHQVGKCIPEKLWRNCPDWRMTNMPKRLTAKIQFFQSRISFHSHGDFLHLITGQTNSLDGLYFSPPCHFHSTGQCHVLAFFKNKLFILPQLRVLSNTFPPLAHQHSRLEVTKR